MAIFRIKQKKTDHSLNTINILLMSEYGRITEEKNQTMKSLAIPHLDNSAGKYLKISFQDGNLNDPYDW